MHTQFIKSKKAHNRAEEQAIAKRLYDLCVAAGLEEAKLRIKSSKTATETKTEEPTKLDEAETAIRELDASIAALQKGNLFQLDKAVILNAELQLEIENLDLLVAGVLKAGNNRYLAESQGAILASYVTHSKTAGKKVNIPCCVVTLRLNSLLTLLLEHGIESSIPQALATAASELNYFAYKTLRARLRTIKNDTLLSLLTSALEAIPSNEEQTQDQEVIITDLIEENSQNPFFSNAPLETKTKLVIYAALRLLSPALIEKIVVQLVGTTDLNLPLESLIEKLTPQNKDRIEKILHSLLNHLTFSEANVKKGLLKAIEMDCATEAPAIIEILKANVSVADLSIKVRDLIADGKASAKAIQALHTAAISMSPNPGTDTAVAMLNPDHGTGYLNLRYTIERNNDALLEMLLTLSWFSTEQLNAALLHAFVCPETIKTEIFKILFAHGANFNLTLSRHGSAEITLAEHLLVFLQLSEQLLSPRDSEKALQLFLAGIPTLTKFELNELLLKVSICLPDKYAPEALKTIIRALVEAGTDLDARAPTGQTVLMYMIGHHNYQGAILLLELQKASGKIVMNNGEYYIDMTGHHEHYSFQKQGLFDLLSSKKTDLFLLAKANPDMIAALIAYGYRVSKDTLEMYEKIIAKKSPGLDSPYKDALSILTAHFKNQATLKVEQPEISDEKEEFGTELKPLTRSNTDTLTLHQIQQFTFKDFIAKRNPSTLAKALNCVLEADIEEANANNNHLFDNTINFIVKLKASRFDYIKVFTDTTHFPLRFILELANKAPENSDRKHLANAANILLASAPFSQLQKIKSYEQLIKSLPTLLKDLLKIEYDKPRADLPDLVFYLQHRAKKPDEQFYKRAVTLTSLLSKLRGQDANVKKIIEDEMRTTTILGFGGQTTRIMEAMLQEMQSTSLKSTLAVCSRLRFFYNYNANDPMIMHAANDVQVAFSNRPKE